MVRGCALIDSRLDTAKICSDGRVHVDHAQLPVVLGEKKRFSTASVNKGPWGASELGPLIPQQRTCSDYCGMSVWCQEETHAPQQIALTSSAVASRVGGTTKPCIRAARWATRSACAPVFGFAFQSQYCEGSGSASVTCAHIVVLPPASLTRLVGSDLLTRAILDRLFDLLLHRFEVEGSRVLHRRKFDCRLGQLPDILLNQDETPELTGEEVVAIAECARVDRFASNERRALERILANVDDRRHVRRGFLARPAPRLHVELELEVVDADRTQLGSAEVKDLLALGWAFPGEQIHLIVAIQMVLIGPIAELHALQQLLSYIGIARRSRQGGSQSSPEKIPFSTLPGLTRPGQRMMHGTRKPPSPTVPLVFLNGVMPPSGQVNTSAPLSVVKMTMVLLASPMSSRCFSSAPTLSSSCAMPASSRP